MELDLIESGLNTGNVERNSGVELRFKDITYTVKNKKYKKNSQKDKHKQKELTILNQVSGVIEPGQMLALMGPSGSGKSTLLDILAQRKETGTISGQILVNGKEIGKAYKSFCSYVTQEDTLLQTATVQETLRFYADLTLPTLSDEEKSERVKTVMQDIGLYEKANTLVGGVLPGGIILKGLSGGQKKRVSIGCALVTNPSLIFLDEPTSGLDSVTALSIMKILLGLTKKGVTVVCSIHQPRSEIWQLFNKVMVLVKGKMIYAGTDVMGYYEGLGYTCPNNVNPADFVLDASVEMGESAKYNEICAKWREHSQQESLIYDNQIHKDIPIAIPKQPSYIYQYKVLLGRAKRDFVRNYGNLVARVATSIVMGLLFGACFYGLDLNQNDLQKIVGVVFFLVSGINLIPYACISLFLSGRALFNAERASRLYHSLPYFLATMTMEMIVVLAVTIGFVGTTYALAHLRWNVARFFYSLLVFFFLHILSDLCIVLISNITGTSDETFAIASGVSVIWQLFAGFFVTVDQLPKAFGWLHYINPLFYGFTSTMINEFEDRILICPKESIIPCQYPNGNDLLKNFGIDDWTRGTSFAVVVAWTAFFFVASYLSLHYLNKEKR
ncbi:ABC transporter G family protein [Tieghemostelium lacteum]|uniref:ABC transporter G family protein n=1 Tax=Tieghemostelium lacteum TaxID=361077 RepID=A0A151ZC29_TIELA|nr:ABC transporter G family protein [Tieghemostelium lacteum]|eukprot:KYQ91489.1 ABC transporter G family protein [Tieghemostelium lacteum]